MITIGTAGTTGAIATTGAAMAAGTTAVTTGVRIIAMTIATTTAIAAAVDSSGEPGHDFLHAARFEARAILFHLADRRPGSPLPLACGCNPRRARR
jgi:hypothetical protein